MGRPGVIFISPVGPFFSVLSLDFRYCNRTMSIEEKDEIVTLIEPFAKSPQFYSRFEAVKALSQLKSSISVKTLKERALDFEEDLDLRLEALEGLMDFSSSGLCDSLIDLLKDSSYEIRIRVVQLIGKSNDPKFLPQLLTTLKDPGMGYEEDEDYSWDYQWDVQLETIRALGNMKNAQAVEPIIEFYEEEKVQDLYESVFSTLCRIGSQGSLGFMKGCLENGDSVERRVVLSRMGEYGIGELKDHAVRLLSDTDPDVRIGAMKTLSQLNSSLAVEFLPGLLNDKDESVREEAVQIFSKVQPNEWEEKILPLLQDPIPAVRIAALKGLSHLNSEAVLHQVQNVLAEDEDGGVLLQALRHLSSIGDQEIPNSLAGFILEEKNPTHFRIQCIQIFQEYFPEKIPELLPSPREISPRQVAIAVASGMVKSGNKKACLGLIPLLTPEELEPSDESKESEETENFEETDSFCEEAVEEMTGGEKPTDNLEDERDLQSSEQPRDDGIRKGKGKLRVKFPGETPGSCKPEDILNVLSDCPFQEVLPSLAEWLESDDTIMAGGAALALGKLNAKEFGPNLETALESPSALLRSKAAIALADLAYSPCCTKMGELLSSDPEELVREKAAETLGRIGSEESVDLLISGLEDPEVSVRRTTVLALGNSGNQKGTIPLVQSLFDHEKFSGIRPDICTSLAQLDKGKAKEQLIEVLHSEDRVDDHWVAIETLGQLFSKQ